jgi:hypothetical protein
MRRPLIYLLIALIAGIIAGSHLRCFLLFIIGCTHFNSFFLFVTIRNHGYKTPKQALETDSAALRPACAGFYFRNWSFTNKWSTAGFFLIISFIFVLGVFDIQKQNYFIEDERNIYNILIKAKLPWRELS